MQNREDVAVLVPWSCPFAGAARCDESNREEYRGARPGLPDSPEYGARTVLGPEGRPTSGSGNLLKKAAKWPPSTTGHTSACAVSRSTPSGVKEHGPPGGPGRTGEHRDLSRGRTQRGPLAQLVRAHG